MDSRRSPRYNPDSDLLMPFLHSSRTARAHTTAAGAIFILLVSCGHPGGTTPSQLDHFPSDLSNPQVDASGIYPDGWIADTASANLQQPGGDQVLSIRGTIPKIGDPAFKTEMTLLVDGAEVGRWPVGLGDFKLSAPVEDQPGKRRVSVAFSESQLLPAGDGRMVGAQLKFLGFEPVKSTDSVDVVKGTNLQLGSGWGPIEVFHGQHFRWVENDAHILITPQKTGDLELSMEAEAGPGVGGQCLLKVLDAAGRQVAAVLVEGKKAGKLFLPVETGKPNEFKLHVDGGGRRIPNDPRILNFRVFQVAAEPWPPIVRKR
jgi:hypothetical protein